MIQYYKRCKGPDIYMTIRCKQVDYSDGYYRCLHKLLSYFIVLVRHKMKLGLKGSLDVAWASRDVGLTLGLKPLSGVSSSHFNGSDSPRMTIECTIDRLTGSANMLNLMRSSYLIVNEQQCILRQAPG